MIHDTQSPPGVSIIMAATHEVPAAAEKQSTPPALRAEEPLLETGGEPSDPKPERFSLKKEVSLVNAVSIIVGTIIGSGIFISPTGVLKRTESVGLALLVWLGAGIIAIGGGLCYVELGTCIPKSGAEYAYLMEAFGQLPAFLFAWTTVLITRPASRAIMAITFAQYVVKPVFPECDPPSEALKLMACVLLVVTAALNCWSVKWTTRVIDVFTYGKVLSIIILIVVGFVHLGKGYTEYLQDAFANSSTNPGDIALAFYLGGWAYSGWGNLNYITEEMKHPERDMPRAIISAVCLVIVLYLLVNVSYLAVLGPSGVLQSEAVAVSIGNAYLGPMAWIMPLFVAVSVFGSCTGSALVGSRSNVRKFDAGFWAVLGFTMGSMFLFGFTQGCKARVVFAAARERHLPQLLAMIQVKRYTPAPSVIFSTIISLIMLIPESSSFSTLIGFFSFAAWLFLGSTFSALLWLRWKKPEMRRIYKVWLFVPIVMILVSLYLVIAPITKQPIGTLIALAIILSGLPFYFLFVHKNRSPVWLSKATGEGGRFGILYSVSPLSYSYLYYNFQYFMTVFIGYVLVNLKSGVTKSF